jgi:protein-S-isoprenylcysteine O-methyltransferase Ste14
MPLLFSYGTLRREEVQLATFGRVLAGRPDTLIGYEVTPVTVSDPQFAADSGQAVHASLQHTGRSDSRVAGLALEVTEAELAAADRYEARAEFHRQRVTLASGDEAWVYTAARKGLRVALLSRVVLWSSLFIALVLIYVPGRLLTRSGVLPPAAPGVPQLLGLLAGVAGAVIAVASIVSFATQGRGTPAPFDPPRRLVVRGPYRFVRNPMYLGAGLALAGAALYFGSWWLLMYAVLFMLTAHSVVVAHEEPALRRAFGQDYAGYCAAVHRWWPHL